MHRQEGSAEGADRRGAESRNMNGAIAVPRADLREFADRFVLQLDLPGVAQEGLELSLERGSLSVRGSVELRAPEGLKLRHGEFASRTLQREFRVGDGIDTDRIEAALTDGVLTVTLPKTVERASRKIQVRAS